tara:strand:+ start:61251 stop:63041 length:1791 start_codon:yes stop_codon:yes gene_type:complete
MNKPIFIVFIVTLLSYWGVAKGFSSKIISNTDYLSAQPIVIQSVQKNNSVQYTTQAFNLSYTKSMTSPSLSLIWQKNITAPVSQPIYVGMADFPFPDRWPWTHDSGSPPENNLSAQKYSEFQKAQSQRSSVVYQIDGKYTLHGFDLKTGQSLVNISLSELLNTEFLLAKGQLGAEPQMVISDAFINNSWHTLLIAAVGERRQTIFCLDITHPFLLAGRAAKNQVWWQKTDSRGYFSRPTIIRAADGYWNVLLAQEGCLDDVFVAGIIKIYSLQNGSGKNEIILPAFAPNLIIEKQNRLEKQTDVAAQKVSPSKHSNGKGKKSNTVGQCSIDNTEISVQPTSFKQSSADTKGKTTDMAQCQNRIQFVQMSPIDSRSRGYVDFLYVGDNYGTLWKFDMTAKTPKQWGLVKQTKDNMKNRMGVFSMVEGEQYGQILSQPKIISHSTGQGVLISCLAQSKKTHNHYLVSIWDKGLDNYVFSDLHDVNIDVSENWYINNAENSSTPIVRNNRVLSVLPGYQAATFDMKNGQKHSQSPYELIGNINQSNQALELVGEPLVFQQGAAEPNMLLHGLLDGSFVWTEINIESDRIGRRVWRELNE